jgi:hypothetical protein
MNKKQIATGAFYMILAAAIIRLVPYIFPMENNFIQPVMAMGIFSISVFRKNWFAAWLPLAALLMGDLLIEAIKPGFGFYEGQVANYACLFGAMLLSYFVKPFSSRSVALGVFLVPTLYYIISNYMVWQGSGLYAPTNAGLMQSYAIGFPHYLKDLASTALFSALLFGIYNFVLQKNAVTEKA